MASIYLERLVGISPERAWKELKKIDAPKHLSDMVASMEVLADNVRACSTADGARIVERVISVDDAHKRLAYTVTESPFSAEHHNASWQVFEGDKGGSRVVWAIDILPDVLAEQMGPVFAGDMDAIVGHLGKLGSK